MLGPDEVTSRCLSRGLWWCTHRWQVPSCDACWGRDEPLLASLWADSMFMQQGCNGGPLVTLLMSAHLAAGEWTSLTASQKAASPCSLEQQAGFNVLRQPHQPAQSASCCQVVDPAPSSVIYMSRRTCSLMLLQQLTGCQVKKLKLGRDLCKSIHAPVWDSWSGPE